MSHDNEFLDDVAIVLREGHFQERSPAALIEMWKQFVEEVEEGYRWDVSEYLNEIRVRDALDSILADQRLAHFSQVREIERQVALVDDRFRGLLSGEHALPAEAKWWRRGVLKRAGENYAGYMKRAHGFEVEIVSEE